MDSYKMTQNIRSPSLIGQTLMAKIYRSEKSQRENSEQNVPGFAFWNNTRIYILAISLTCLTFSQINSITFNLTVICMKDVVEEHHATNQSGLHWVENVAQKSILFSGAAIGGIMGLFPSVPMLNQFGLRTVMTISGFISAVGSLLFPAAVSMNFYVVLLCRVLQGLGISVFFTVISVISRTWAPNTETSTFLAILSCALQFSNIICMPVSGVLCESSLGWRSIYYISGIATILAHTLFYFTYTDSPKLHKNISHREVVKISEGKNSKEKETVPYRAICTDPCVIVTWISCFGGNLGFFVLSLYGPTYLSTVLQLDIRSTGILSALPFVLSAILKFISGQISDRMTFVSEKARFVLFAGVSQIGLAIGFLVMALTTNQTIAKVSFIFAIVSSGLNILGTARCVQLRCQQHVHFAIAVVAFSIYVDQVVGPLGVAIFCPDNTASQWSKFFVVISIFIIVMNLPFPFFTTSKPADYTYPKKQKSTVSSEEAV